MATMRDSDEILLKGLRDTVCADVSAADWDLVLKAVTDAGDVRNVRGMARTILFDAVEKASFATRSEAGRYAANMRWKGHVVQGAASLKTGKPTIDSKGNASPPFLDTTDIDGPRNGGKQITSPEEAQIVVETLNTNTATRYGDLRAEGKTHSRAYTQAKKESVKGLIDKKGKVKVPLNPQEQQDLDKKEARRLEGLPLTPRQLESARTDLTSQLRRAETLGSGEKGMSADRKAELGAKFPKAGMVVDIPSKPRTAEESARIQANFEIARAASKKKKKG